MTAQTTVIESPHVVFFTYGENRLQGMKKFIAEKSENGVLNGRHLIIDPNFRFEKKQICNIYVNMVGDLFHAGHMNFIEQAIQEADKELDIGVKIQVFVGICSDEDCTAYKKQPMENLAERVARASYCSLVKAVLIPAPLRVDAEVIDGCKIDLVMHRNDFPKDKLQEYYGEAINRGILRTVPYTEGISTSELIRRIQSRPPV